MSKNIINKKDKEDNDNTDKQRYQNGKTSTTDVKGRKRPNNEKIIVDQSRTSKSKSVLDSCLNVPKTTDPSSKRIPVNMFTSQMPHSIRSNQPENIVENEPAINEQSSSKKAGYNLNILMNLNPSLEMEEHVKCVTNYDTTKQDMQSVVQSISRTLNNGTESLNSKKSDMYNNENASRPFDFDITQRTSQISRYKVPKNPLLNRLLFPCITSAERDIWEFPEQKKVEISTREQSSGTFLTKTFRQVSQTVMSILTTGSGSSLGSRKNLLTSDTSLDLDFKNLKSRSRVFKNSRLQIFENDVESIIEDESTSNHKTHSNINHSLSTTAILSACTDLFGISEKNEVLPESSECWTIESPKFLTSLALSKPSASKNVPFHKRSRQGSKKSITSISLNDSARLRTFFKEAKPKIEVLNELLVRDFKSNETENAAFVEPENNTQPITTFILENNIINNKTKNTSYPCPINNEIDVAIKQHGNHISINLTELSHNKNQPHELTKALSQPRESLQTTDEFIKENINSEDSTYEKDEQALTISKKVAVSSHSGVITNSDTKVTNVNDKDGISQMAKSIELDNQPNITENASKETRTSENKSKGSSHFQYLSTQDNSNDSLEFVNVYISRVTTSKKKCLNAMISYPITNQFSRNSSDRSEETACYKAHSEMLGLTCPLDIPRSIYLIQLQAVHQNHGRAHSLKREIAMSVSNVILNDDENVANISDTESTEANKSIVFSNENSVQNEIKLFESISFSGELKNETEYSYPKSALPYGNINEHLDSGGCDNLGSSENVITRPEEMYGDDDSVSVIFESKLSVDTGNINFSAIVDSGTKIDNNPNERDSRVLVGRGSGSGRSLSTPNCVYRFETDSKKSERQLILPPTRASGNKLPENIPLTRIHASKSHTSINIDNKSSISRSLVAFLLSPDLKDQSEIEISVSEVDTYSKEGLESKVDSNLNPKEISVPEDDTYSKEGLESKEDSNLNPKEINVSEDDTYSKEGLEPKEDSNLNPKENTLEIPNLLDVLNIYSCESKLDKGNVMTDDNETPTLFELKRSASMTNIITSSEADNTVGRSDSNTSRDTDKAAEELVNNENPWRKQAEEVECFPVSEISSPVEEDEVVVESQNDDLEVGGATSTEEPSEMGGEPVSDMTNSKKKETNEPSVIPRGKEALNKADEKVAADRVVLDNDQSGSSGRRKLDREAVPEQEKPTPSGSEAGEDGGWTFVERVMPYARYLMGPTIDDAFIDSFIVVVGGRGCEMCVAKKDEDDAQQRVIEQTNPGGRNANSAREDNK